MEEYNKKRKILIIILITVSVLVLCEIIFIVISKNNNLNETAINNTTDNNDIENETNEDEEDNQLNNAIEEIKKLFPESNDSKVTGSVPHKKFDLENGERHAEKFTFYYNNYKFYYNYLDGSGDGSEITIYDKKTNKKLYTNKYIKTFLDVDEYITTLPTISNDKLHLIAYKPNDCYDDYEYEVYHPYLEYIQIDLSGTELEEKTIITIKGIQEGQRPDCE